MPGNRTSIEKFLAASNMHPAGINTRKCCDDFTAEMTRGLNGEQSSLVMIPTYIETAREVPRGQTVIALDAGGTNLRVAAVSFDQDGKAVIEHLTRHRMPGIDAEIGKEEFFHDLADYVMPLADRSEKIGFCFSYPAEILPDKDGKLIHFTKEVKARGVDGQLLGRNLSMAMAASGADRPPRVVLLNDTAATLLAGRNAIPDRRFSDFVGVVCGTGFNVSYVERNDLIRKLPGLDPSGSQVVNTESGSFGLAPTGSVDDEFDATTATPRRYRHEKMISGAYLGTVGLFAARSAAKAGCFSSEAAPAFSRLQELSTRDFNAFLLRPESGDNPLGAISLRLPAEDRTALVRLFDALVERASLFVASTISAVVLKTGKGKDPSAPVCITVDGTTYWELSSFHKRVQSHLGSFLSGDRQRAWEITSVSDAPLLGAAIAALTN
ncbi:MAG TPA: hexokinase [Spirochaetia bacterium]|nr:hexokinase [Spirochaetia bacterium]